MSSLVQENESVEMVSPQLEQTAPVAEPSGVSQTKPLPQAGDLASVRPMPRISIQAFCETPEVAGAIEHTAEDRRMAKTHVKVYMGGIPAAADFYREAPTPNLVLVESTLKGMEMVNDLERLAEVCDPGSKVVVLGHDNDVQLYRELIARGVSEYLVAPASMADIMKVVSELFVNPDAEPLGQTIAFIGAKGGVGSSTIAHNIAWTISSEFSTDTVIADLDLAFGTANINFDQDPAQGIAEAVYSADRVDDTFVDRLLAKCSDHLSLLAAPSMLDRTYDFGVKEFNPVLDVVQRNIPCAVLDLPHAWNGWTQEILANVDQVIITATPDLANLRNSKNMVDTLRELRPNDSPPHIILNQVSVPKRPEISVADFTDPLELEPLAVIPFDAGFFGTAANNGQMLSEADAKHETSETLLMVAQVLTGRSEAKTRKKSGGASLLGKLLGKNK
jgi:pilus assembly protein CpaE